MSVLSGEVLAQIYDLHILIVDDNEINRIFIEKILRTRGFHNVLCLSSAEECLAHLEQYAADLVILDILMPGMDGFDCCAAIRALSTHSDLPIFIQTSLTDDDLRYKAFVKGATDFISKPVYPDEFFARVIVHLERRLYLKNLQTYKRRVTAQLEEARHLQYAILPDEYSLNEVRIRCHLDIAAHLQTSSEVGGDFWGMKLLFPGQVAFWITDLSGHGIAAALNAFSLQAYIKDYSDLMARPGEYLAHLNDKLLHLLKRGHFATMFYAIADTKRGQLHYAAACAPHPILVRTHSGISETIDGSGFPLGIALAQYTTQTARFAQGDILLLYSDAFIETPCTTGGYILENEITDVIKEHQSLSSEDIKTALMHFFQARTGGVLKDDFSFVVCKYHS